MKKHKAEEVTLAVWWWNVPTLPAPAPLVTSLSWWQLQLGDTQRSDTLLQLHWRCCHHGQLSLSLSLCHSTRGRSRDKKSSIFTRWQKCCYWADLPAWFCPVIGPRGSGGPQDGLPLAGRVTWLGPVAVLGWDFLWKVWKSGSSTELSWSRPWRRGQARAHCAPVHLCGPIIGTLFPTQCKLV